MKDNITWQELMASMDSAKAHPTDTAWDIYWYLKNNYQECGSEQTRMLLFAYTKIPLERPSLLHSCILQLALKISEQYDDFNLLNFIRIWGYNQFLRSEDKEGRTTEDGKYFISLEDRTERTVREYLNRHPEHCPLKRDPELPMILPPIIGYVNSYDAKNDFFHIFDNASRHFVAKSPKVLPLIGEYVWFTPIIPANSRFKSAVIIKQEEHIAGRETFGTLDAVYLQTDTEKKTFRYKITSPLPDADGGTMVAEGNASLKLLNCPKGKYPEESTHLKLVVFLVRGSDGTKYNHVAEAVLN